MGRWPKAVLQFEVRLLVLWGACVMQDLLLHDATAADSLR